jgi:ketosteroid isomerase-like protein
MSRPERFIDAGDCAVQVGRTRGRVHATAKTFDVAGVHAWTLRDGMVVRYGASIDHPAMLPALQSG